VSLEADTARELGTRFMLFSFVPARLTWVRLAQTSVGDQRNEWLQQEVSCLLCGRLIARLVYPIRAANVAHQREPFVAAHRSSDELRNLRCATCGGTAVFNIAERVWMPQCDVDLRTPAIAPRDWSVPDKSRNTASCIGRHNAP
jgi:hypothetical protein